MDPVVVRGLYCRLSDSEAKSQPAYKQDPVSLLPPGGAAVPMSEQVRKWLRLLRLEEAALHQDIKRQCCLSVCPVCLSVCPGHAFAQAYSTVHPCHSCACDVPRFMLLLLSVLFASVVNIACSNMRAL